MGSVLYGQLLLLDGQPAQAEAVLRELCAAAPPMLRATLASWGGTHPNPSPSPSPCPSPCPSPSPSPNPTRSPNPYPNPDPDPDPDPNPKIGEYTPSYCRLEQLWIEAYAAMIGAMVAQASWLGSGLVRVRVG